MTRSVPRNTHEHALLTYKRGQFPNDSDGEDIFHNKPISYLSTQKRGEIFHDIGEGREETVLKMMGIISDRYHILFVYVFQSKLKAHCFINPLSAVPFISEKSNITPAADVLASSGAILQEAQYCYQNRYVVV